MLRGAEIAQARVRLGSEAFKQRGRKPRFADTGLAGEQHHLAFVDLSRTTGCPSECSNCWTMKNPGQPRDGKAGASIGVWKFITLDRAIPVGAFRFGSDGQRSPPCASASFTKPCGRLVNIERDQTTMFVVGRMPMRVPDICWGSTFDLNQCGIPRAS